MCFKYPTGELDKSTGNSPFIAGIPFLKHPANSDKAKNKIDAWKKNGWGERKEQKNVCHILRDE